MPRGKYVRTPEMRAKTAAAQRAHWQRYLQAQPPSDRPIVAATEPQSAHLSGPSGEAALVLDNTPRMIRRPADVLAVANHWLENKRVELARAEQAARALRRLDVPLRRRTLAFERVRFLKRFIGALEQGYVPIPRFDADTLDLNVEELPAEALVAMAETKGKKLFDEVRYVTGREPEAHTRGGRYDRSGRWTHRGRGGVDPLIVGVIRTPEHRVPNPRAPSARWEDRVIPSREEHFLIAWWRPEDTTDADLF